MMTFASYFTDFQQKITLTKTIDSCRFGIIKSELICKEYLAAA